MKSSQVFALALLLLHMSALAASSICFSGEFHEARANSHEHAHYNGSHHQSGDPESLDCLDAMIFMVSNGKSAPQPGTGIGAAIADAYAAFANIDAANNTLSESLSPDPVGLPPYLVFSVLRI